MGRRTKAKHMRFGAITSAEIRERERRKKEFSAKELRIDLLQQCMKREFGLPVSYRGFLPANSRPITDLMKRGFVTMHRGRGRHSPRISILFITNKGIEYLKANHSLVV